ncbi:alpha/beta fold hydrolase [uncultured Jatrophihabitans sp.]|uniref:alpha/beta fold hydrolase n=1 Tax=uncultured Jatrophihabitans sp. TaxID=1610747 RepID=UPI0035CA459A
MPKPPTRTAPRAKLADVDLPSLDGVQMWPGHEVQLGNRRIHVRTTPADGDSVEQAVFVHGLGGSAHNWTDFAALLRGRLAIDALDLPGHGRSPGVPNRDYNPVAHAQVVIDYIEQYRNGPVHLIGNSMGGAVSILVAARRPDLIRTLTLISPAVPDNRVRVFPLRNDPRMAILVVPVLGEFLMKQFDKRYAPEARVKGTIALCFADRKRYPKQRLDEAVAEARDRLDKPWAAAAFLRSMRTLATSQILRGRKGWATMRKITAPTLVLWGDTDRLVAPDLAPYVAAAIPDSRLLVFDDIGHTAMMEDPAATARAVLAFLDETAPTGS